MCAPKVLHARSASVANMPPSCVMQSAMVIADVAQIVRSVSHATVSPSANLSLVLASMLDWSVVRTFAIRRFPAQNATTINCSLFPVCFVYMCVLCCVYVCLWGLICSKVVLRALLFLLFANLHFVEEQQLSCLNYSFPSFVFLSFVAAQHFSCVNSSFLTFLVYREGTF